MTEKLDNHKFNTSEYIEVKPLNRWRDISTAPKDGSEILIHSEGEYSIVCFKEKRWVGMCEGYRAIESQTDFSTDYHEPWFKYWQPLDTPPTEKEDV